MKLDYRQDGVANLLSRKDVFYYFENVVTTIAIGADKRIPKALAIMQQKAYDLVF
jgi:hypothetical protein